MQSGLGLKALGPYSGRVDELVQSARPRPQTSEVATGERIIVEHAWFRYSRDDRWVLQNHDFQVRRGEMVHLRAPSGSGKSTLLRLIRAPLPSPSLLYGDSEERSREAASTECRPSLSGHLLATVSAVQGRALKQHFALRARAPQLAAVAESALPRSRAPCPRNAARFASAQSRAPKCSRTTRTGVVWLRNEQLPSWPSLPLPQHSTVPLASFAQL